MATITPTQIATAATLTGSILGAKNLAQGHYRPPLPYGPGNRQRGEDAEVLLKNFLPGVDGERKLW